MNAFCALSITRSVIAPFLINASLRSSRSREVSIVTANIFVLLFPLPAIAALTTCGSPWTVRKSKSYLAIPLTAFSTVAPISKNFISKKTL